MEARMPLPETDGRQIRKFFVSTTRESVRETFSYPCLFKFHIARDVLDQFVNCRLVLFVAARRTRSVKEID